MGLLTEALQTGIIATSAMGNVVCAVEGVSGTLIQGDSLCVYISAVSTMLQLSKGFTGSQLLSILVPATDVQCNDVNSCVQQARMRAVIKISKFLCNHILLVS